MKIGIYDPYLDDLGGGEKYMMTIAEVLSKDHEVSVFWDKPEDLKPLTQRFALDISKIKVVKNIFSPSISLPSRFLESKKYDAIIVLSDGSIPVLGTKLYVHFQQPFPNIQAGFKNKLKGIKVNAYFCNSEFTKSYIDKEFGIQSKVIYPPIDIKPIKVQKENIILTVGRFRVKDVTTVKGENASPVGDYKKQGIMIKAFSQMVKEGLSGWKFIIATSVNENEREIFEEFKKQAKDFPIEFLVNKTNSELWETYSKAKIYWHASGFGEDLTNHPEFAEHFGISTVEAMGAGAVPVVISAGGQKEIVTNERDGYLWETIEELKSFTLKLVENKKLLSDMSSQATKVADLFGGNRFEQEIKSLIK